MRVLKLWIGIPAQLPSMSSHQQVSTAVPLPIIEPGSIDKEKGVIHSSHGTYILIRVSGRP